MKILKIVSLHRRINDFVLVLLVFITAIVTEHEVSSDKHCFLFLNVKESHTRILNLHYPHSLGN